jgi:protein-L-isoaspartate(D-aspartate) O-methyltransferase
MARFARAALVAAGVLVVALIIVVGVSEWAATPGPSASEQAPEARLDRQVTDTEALQQTRDRFVDANIEPVVTNTRVVDAFRAVPRHAFVPADLVPQAYEDHPLPIGYGQTISQPSLVAQMTEMLELEMGDRVLEIGSGSGFQAAILRRLTDEVYSVEIVPELAATGQAVLEALGFHDIELARRDGYGGWPAYAPFDAIIVTAAPDHLPPPLVEQLSPDGGRMVIPIGPVGDVQTLWLVVRHGDEVDMEQIMPVVFVPLTREGD